MRIRDVVPEADYIRLAELISTMENEPWTAAQLHQERVAMAPGQILREMAAEGPDGKLIGMSVVTRLPWWSPGRFGLVVIVDPAARGRGIGTQLHTEALTWAVANGATKPETRVRDDDPLSLRFAEKHGYRMDRHLFNSVLEVAAFDPSPFAGVIAGVQEQGIRFFTMADEGDTPQARRKMYEVNRSCTLDIPGREPTFSDFAQYQQRNFATNAYRPELHLFAADGDRWIGLAALVPMGGAALMNRMTGVVAEYRGRHIALALKLLAIETARRHGFSRLVTNNDAENAPMLAVNRKLGYRPEPGIFLMTRPPA